MLVLWIYMVMSIKHLYNLFLDCVELNTTDQWYSKYTTNWWFDSLQQMKLSALQSHENSPWQQRKEMIGWLWAIKQVMANTHQQYLTKQIDLQRKHELYSACLDSIFEQPLRHHNPMVVFNMLFDEIGQERASGKVITDMDCSVVSRIY